MRLLWLVESILISESYGVPKDISTALGTVEKPKNSTQVETCLSIRKNPKNHVDVITELNGQLATFLMISKMNVLAITSRLR